MMISVIRKVQREDNKTDSQASKIKATILGDVESMFPSVEALKKVEDNCDLDATELYWKNRIKASGGERYLASVP